MVDIAPQIYRHPVIYEKGWPVLYIALKKDIYGYLRLAFMFYEWFLVYTRGNGV